ncbi:hypothetical protein Q1695_012960 [Nippostrongylus brasiliensis]|nr:hypothetical protein Q1695_012960 [Nippostrongylus brasiliensis]
MANTVSSKIRNAGRSTKNAVQNGFNKMKRALGIKPKTPVDKLTEAERSARDAVLDSCNKAGQAVEKTGKKIQKEVKSLKKR